MADKSSKECPPNFLVFSLVMCLGLMKLHCHGVPTANANQFTLATTITSANDTTSIDKLMALKEGNDQQSVHYKNEMPEDLRATATTTTTTSRRKGDTVTVSTTTYDQHAYVTNSSIDIALTPMMSLLPPNVAFSLKASAETAPKDASTTAATFDTERVQNERYEQQKNDKQQHQQLPTITRAMQVARIYESFRALPELDVHSAADSAPRFKRMSDLATDDTPHATASSGNMSTTWPPTTTTTTTANVNANVTTASNMRKRTASADMLSRNISIILENLLKSYEQSQLPTHGQGIPTVVRTNILIRSMGPVSELDMDYSMDCYFRQYWHDKRLSFQGPIQSLSLSIKMLDKIWRPDTYFFNGKHSHIHTITVPNKLLRLDQNGGILYSMRLTIKATCPMELKNFPMDLQSCPLIIGSYGYTNRQLVYEWKGEDDAVSFVPGMTLNQFDLISMKQRNFTYTRREGDFSVLHVAFNLKRHTGYFLIQVYVPCILIVVLSWVSFWIHREATSDRVGLCVTAVLTLSTISLDSRTDLPKVKYATALDWFLLMSFLYCIATLLEFAGVHYFTKVGSGEIPISEDEWEDIDEGAADDDEGEEEAQSSSIKHSNESAYEIPHPLAGNFCKRNAMISPIFNDPTQIFPAPSSHASTMERTTQTEPPVISKGKQMWLCLIGDDKFRRQRERAAAVTKGSRYVNSVSLIDRVSRVAFPMSFAFFNLLYWLAYGMYKKEFTWSTVKG
ncbi:PREDICTED: gamma-aminobutyric acid receptor subunit alpha-6 [Bactrocera latifrons]|uniref:gamma-aminobutyric acid receptor subunit alpha-6 n=1 Tax=Bactrocera latifrons TaxID=174628 RepID=UPI0008DD303D|nr:PREDICTED: gamma-aminobutyric acid receptor subunit alpha-6 [Bactrocera latifrons]